MVGHIAYRTWTDRDKQKNHHTSIVIDSFTLLGRPTFQTGESATDSDDGGGTVAVDADQSSEIHDDNPFSERCVHIFLFVGNITQQGSNSMRNRIMFVVKLTSQGVSGCSAS